MRHTDQHGRGVVLRGWKLDRHNLHFLRVAVQHCGTSVQGLAYAGHALTWPVLRFIEIFMKLKIRRTYPSDTKSALTDTKLRYEKTGC
jgi:hypothetical protein